jgi:hypothetical protein
MRIQPSETKFRAAVKAGRFEGKAIEREQQRVLLCGNTANRWCPVPDWKPLH